VPCVDIRVRNESRNKIHPTTSPDYQDEDNKGNIYGKSLKDKIRSDQLRQLSRIQDIIKWANVRRKEWDAHVERMEDNCLAKIARDNHPQGVCSRGRPKKHRKESLNTAPSP
jgi:cell fate regulator YaaT (PSP1 superfamily)